MQQVPVPTHAVGLDGVGQHLVAEHQAEAVERGRRVGVGGGEPVGQRGVGREGAGHIRPQRVGRGTCLVGDQLGLPPGYRWARGAPVP